MTATSTLPATDGAAHEAPADVTDDVADERPEVRESRGRRIARVAGVVVASAVLFGSGYAVGHAVAGDAVPTTGPDGSIGQMPTPPDGAQGGMPGGAPGGTAPDGTAPDGTGQGSVDGGTSTDGTGTAAEGSPV